MKVFRDLEINVPSAIRDEFITLLEKRLTPEWCRDREAEERGRKFLRTDIFNFVCEKSEERQGALLALTSKNTNMLYVSNIVPRESGRLTFDQYNYILNEFLESFVAPLVTEMGLSFKTTTDKQTIEDWISSDSAIKLRSFSGAANKSTGSSHPCDQERWFDFIIGIVKSGDGLDASTLQRWLIEEETWPEDIANELAIQFEQEVALLEYYRKNQ